MKNILIIDDDMHIGNMLEEALKKEGYGVLRAYSGTEALYVLSGTKPDLVLLDLMLPGMTGEEVLSKIKEESPGTAVIVASARESLKTRIMLLKAGADDYLVKPFDTEELIARLGAVLRRSGKGLQEQPGTDRKEWAGTGKKPRDSEGRKRIHYKDITMYPEDFSAFVGEQELTLTKREYLILALLMENPGKVFTKSNIYESVWNEEFLGEDNAVNVQKLAKLGNGETYIQTVWGIGFKMK